MPPIACRTAVAALAFACAHVALAATATVAPSTGRASVGETFFVTVSGAGFPETSGATLGLTWNSAVVSVTGVELAPSSPFADLLAETPFDIITILGPLSGTQPSGDFTAMRITFEAVAKGDAEIELVDDGADFSWTDVNGEPIAVDYQQASVRIVTPLPGSVLLLGSALGALGFARRRLQRSRLVDVAPARP